MSTTVKPAFTLTVPQVTNDFNGIPPLLTVFTPLSYCSTQYYYDAHVSGTVWVDKAHDPGISSCRPFQNVLYIYKPGVCPSGQEFKLVNAIVEETTATSSQTIYEGFCCSSDFRIYSDIRAAGSPSCIADLTAPVTATIAGTDEDSTTVLIRSPSQR
ncbi:Uu.00g005910.m01.CDS01 [Anthostomella pinea]|uniref:Uu.00g005910.m01.CDS01 n=1 Tax=Anthostomella pinea TaxID=933095 RepID=A0AAI8VL68_9PEZI|nr:Uu.00g005910.m01.CDS01 [Anthostomella pinea]